MLDIRSERAYCGSRTRRAPPHDVRDGHPQEAAVERADLDGAAGERLAQGDGPPQNQVGALAAEVGVRLLLDQHDHVA